MGVSARLGIAIALAGGIACSGATPGSASAPAAAVAATARGGTLRLAGTVEATRAQSVLVPRLAGQTAPTLVITRLARAGSKVESGEMIIEFDPQEQRRIAFDKRAELVDLDGQIQKKRSEHDVNRSRDETELAEAERNVERAALDVRKNDLVARVEAEKNTLAFEQANARLAQLKETFALKRRAAEAEIKILEIQRERADRARRYAEGNAELMAVHAPFSGLVVLKQVWKGNNQAEVAEGEEVRPGIPVLDIVDPASMQVRARVSQADVSLISPGQTAKIRLDAYPDLLFNGKIEAISPLGVQSSMTAKVRATRAVRLPGCDVIPGCTGCRGWRFRIRPLPSNAS